MGSKSLTLISGQDFRLCTSRILCRELIACILVTEIPKCQTVNIPSVFSWNNKVKRRYLCLRFLEVRFVHFMPKQKRTHWVHCEVQLLFTKKACTHFNNFNSAKFITTCFQDISYIIYFHEATKYKSFWRYKPCNK